MQCCGVLDCRLQLKRVPSVGGHLDYTMLPIYTTDCVVDFPMPDDDHQMSSNSPTGILIELQRLNAPCFADDRTGSIDSNDQEQKSGQDRGRTRESYIRFGSNSAIICGKLEELSLNERFYRFDMRDQVSVQFYNNPMFSLSYKLVDYCYNVSTSNETGHFYIPPSISANLECYFRIHLPHGNRILLTIVTNNDSEIITNYNHANQQHYSNVNSNNNDYQYNGDDNEEYDNNDNSNNDNEQDRKVIWTRSGKSLVPKVIYLSSKMDKLPLTARTANGSLNKDIEHDFSSIGLDTFQFLATNWANMQIIGASAKNAAAATTTASSLSAASKTTNHHHCPDGILIRIFEMEGNSNHNLNSNQNGGGKSNIVVCRWSYCVSDTGTMNAFQLHSTGNRLNVHLLRSLPSNRPSVMNHLSTQVNRIEKVG